MTSTLPPKILILTCGGLEHGGGIGRMIGYLLEAWPRQPGHPTLQVVDTRGPGALWLWPFNFGRAAILMLIAAPRRPLLYIHIAGRGSTLRKVILIAWARLLRQRAVLHLHDYDYADFCRSLPRVLLAAVQWAFRRVDRVIVLGREAESAVRDLLGVAADRISILPNAVSAPTERQSRRNGPVRILFLGQLSRRKGVHDLIAALDMPEMRDLDWTATLAGGGPHSAAFSDQASATVVAERITMPGWLDQAATRSLLGSADILVLPSYAEGLAMSVLEGMAYGLCIITTPVGALPETIISEREGLMVAPGAVEALAGALARCVSDDALRQGLGAGARARFDRDFDVRLYPARLAAIFEAALAGPRPC